MHIISGDAIIPCDAFIPESYTHSIPTWSYNGFIDEAMIYDLLVFKQVTRNERFD